jgi:hypothetical protein
MVYAIRCNNTWTHLRTPAPNEASITLVIQKKFESIQRSHQIRGRNYCDLLPFFQDLQLSGARPWHSKVGRERQQYDNR